MSGMQGVVAGLFVAGLLAFSGVVLVSIMLLMAHLSGWRRLAREFPGRPPAADARGGLTSVGFRALGKYNNCVLWKSDDEALHLRLMPPFNLMGHPPMSIPWAAVEIVKPKSFWGWAQVKVSGIPISLQPKLIEQEVEVRAAMAAQDEVAEARQMAARSS